MTYVKTIHMLEAGDYVERIRSAQFRGPRGGRYEFPETTIGALYVGHKLSSSGALRTVEFDGRKVRIASRVCAALKFEVRS